MLEGIRRTQARAGFQDLVAETVPLAKQQQVLAVQFVAIDLAVRGPGVAGWNDDTERFVVNRLGDQTGFAERQRNDDDVEFAGLERESGCP